MEESIKKETKVINIYPTKNSRRVLVFFADLLILFISAVFLFEMAINPIVKVSSGYSDKLVQADTAERSRTQILYDNELLFYDEDNKYNFNHNLDYTATQFLKYYVFDQKTLQNEVIFHYFNDIRKQNIDFINDIYLKKAERYFDKENFTNLGTYAFKKEYIDLLSPLFIEGDELSEVGQREYFNFKENYFLPIYSTIILDIKENDLKTNISSISLSYNELSNEIEKFDSYLNNTTTLSSYITFFVAVIILYFIIPLTNKKRRTISEMILKVERVDKNTIEYLKKKFVVVEGLFNSISGLTILFLIPIISFGFSKLFLLNLLFSVSFVSLLFTLVQLFVMCFSKYGQSLKELLTNSICVDTSTIDDYYRERGYDN